jgi:hypothetical protein
MLYRRIRAIGIILVALSLLQLQARRPAQASTCLPDDTGGCDPVNFTLVAGLTGTLTLNPATGLYDFSGSSKYTYDCTSATGSGCAPCVATTGYTWNNSIIPPGYVAVDFPTQFTAPSSSCGSTGNSLGVNTTWTGLSSGVQYKILVEIFDCDDADEVPSTTTIFFATPVTTTPPGGGLP